MWRALLAALLPPVFLGGVVWLFAGGQDSAELLNVSYDPTRELWRDLNERFIPEFETSTGLRLSVRQSHGGSASQARAVIDGLEADVVTLALWTDTDAIRRKGLIDAGWEGRLPNCSLPYYSTIVFVVRAGNPKRIHDWPDLVRPGVAIITPNPRTSGNGKLSLLAAWGSVRYRGGSAAEARAFVSQLYRQVPVLDAGARGATVTFAERRLGDVHLTWENEARLEVQEHPGELEVVYPPASLKAEPQVAVVDANVRRKGTARAAEAYLRFLYTESAQEIIARHFYRPINADVRRKHADTLPELDLFPITAVARSWEDVHETFFAPGGVADQIFQPNGN
jgi:sulfate transport system substrate-binding protein